MAGTIYIVGTPIGNLGDLSPRAANILGQVDFVAAEDTRVTLKLLNHLGLKKPLLSYREQNEREQAVQIIQRVAAGESCALCSDAGLPAISDPGERLVKEAKAAELEVIPIPGPNAALTALCASGQDTGRFVFEGFLPQNRNARTARLAALKTEERTVLFYEAPHKLLRTLRDLCEAFGEKRSLSVCRELTKLHEEVWKTTLFEALQHYQTEKPRGEFVLVMAGCPPPQAAAPTLRLEEAAREALRLPLPASEAAKQIATATGHPKSAIYKAMIELKEAKMPLP